MRSELSAIQPFDQVVSASGITYCIEEDFGLHAYQDNIRAHVAYIPTHSGDRKRADGTYQRKCIIEGQPGEAAIINGMSNPHQEEILARFQTDQKTGEVYLTIPHADTGTLYQSQQTLYDLLHGTIYMAQCVVDTVGNGVERVKIESGIPEGAFGIYGGKATGISHVQHDSGDIDLAVHGLQYEEAVLAFCRRYRLKNDKVHQGMRQAELTLGMGRQDTVHFDMVIVRTPDELVDYGAIISAAPAVSLHTVQGLIADLPGKLALPAYYLLETTKDNIQILSPRFHFLASARPGDFLQVTGLSIQDTDWLVLTDPVNHGFHGTD